MKTFIGSKATTKDGDIVVIDYVNNKEVLVRFVDTGYVTRTTVSSIKDGKVKDKLKPSVYGVGFIGDGENRPTVNGKLSKCYRLWQAILKRCYSEKSLKESPCYSDVTVCEEWHNFQNFAKWFDENYISDYHIDKDKLSGDNKIYSPSTCCFITPQENAEIASAKSYTLRSPDERKVKVFNLSKFCRDNNLRVGAMHSVACGITKEHKGWMAFK